MNVSLSRRSSVLLLALVALAASAGVTAAASGASLNAAPDDPRVTSTHTATITVGQATGSSSLNGLSVDYQGTGADVSDVDKADVVTVGVDRGDDESGSTVDVTVRNDLESVDISNGGRTLTAGFGGSYTLQEGDEVVIVYEGVKNPKAGTYDVPMNVNPQSSGGNATAVLSIGSSSSDGGSSADSGSDSDADSGGSTTAQSPGFGVLAAAFALVGAAFLARRR